MTSAGDPDRLVTVHVATSEFEAQSVAAILREREIQVAVFGAAIQAFGLDGVGSRMLGGIPVQVRSEDLERAKSALRANKFLADSVDWDSVDVGEADGEVAALVRTGAFDTLGGLMVRAGRIAAIAIVVLSVVAWVVRCA